MARPAKVRISYTRDVTALSRLKESIERDIKRNIEFRKKCCGLLTDLIYELTKISQPSASEKS